MTKGNKMSTARETVYDRCAYIGCYNGKFINGRRLFHFPSERDRRLEMWIERSGNFRLRTWAATSLRKAGLCGDHFDDKCFTNATRRALRRNVVPRHYTEDRKFRKAKSTTDNNENNKNNKKEAKTEEDEDDPMKSERLFSIPVESAATIEIQTTGSNNEPFSQSGEFAVDQVSTKVEGNRSPSPVVEFIVEELDESLLYEENTISEHDSSTVQESSVDDSTFKYEENCETENEGSCEQSTCLGQFHETRECTEFKESSMKVTQSDSDVRTYYRSKNNSQLKLELPSGDSETFTDADVPETMDENGQKNRHEKMLHAQREENKQLRKAMRVLKQKLRRAKARESHYMKVREMMKNVDEFLNIQECTNPVARAMVKLALHKRNAPYTKEEKDFATQLYRHWSNAFDRLRIAGCNFPGKSTIRRWISENEDQPLTCDFTTGAAANGYEGDEQMLGDIDEGEMVEEIDEDEMVEEIDDGQMVGEMCVVKEQAVEDAEHAIDELVEHLEEQIGDAEGHEEYAEELPPDEDEEEDLK